MQFLHRFISLVPSLRQMGRHDYPHLPVILSEIKLLFFVWIFIMETLLARYQRLVGVDERKENWKKFVPLTFITKAIGPRLMRVQTTVSEQISEGTWDRYIKQKAQRVLELMVMIQFLEVETMEYMLQLLEEGRSLLLLSVFLVLPSSISRVGMLYAQFIFPSARSLVARGDGAEILSLKYWVLNTFLSLFLSLSWWLWWFVPFSNQLIVGIRCFATFPSTITHYYSMVEMELITFGILSGEPKLSVKETKTVQALRAVVKRLPRDKHARSFQFEIDEPNREGKHVDDDSSIGSDDTTESEQERRRKRRREKRAMKKRMQQNKLTGSMNNNSSRPRPLLSDSFISECTSDGNDEHFSSFINTNENHENKPNNNDSTSKVHTLLSYAKDEIVDPTPIEETQYDQCRTEKEERDDSDSSSMGLQLHSQSAKRNERRAEVTLVDSLSDDTNTLIPAPSSIAEREYNDMFSMKPSDSNENYDDSDRALLPSLTIGSNYSSSQILSDLRLINLNIATPTESVVDEVEVQVKATTGRSKSAIRSEMEATSIFPAAYPTSSGSDLIMPLASHEEEICLENSQPASKDLLPKSRTQSSNNDSYDGTDDTDDGLCLSDIETTASSTIECNESFDACSPLHEASNADKKAETDLYERPATQRRSSRLIQLREWQEQKQASESSSSNKEAKKSKTSKSKASTDSKLISKSLSADKKVRKSTTASAAKTKKLSRTSVDKKEKSTVTSPKRSSKKSKIPSFERESVANKSTASFIGKRLKKKSLAASPDKTSRSSKYKGEAPLQDDAEGEVSRSSSSSPLKTTQKKQRKTPNSRRKKKDGSTIFGGVLSRK